MTGNVVNVTVTGAPVAVAVTPSTVTVPEGGSVNLAAAVTGTANTAVTWTVNGIAGGSAAVGFITPAGTYTAPVPAPSPQTVTIRATSVASPSAFGQAAVTVAKPAPPVTVAVTPATASVQAGSAQAFAAARATVDGLTPAIHDGERAAGEPGHKSAGGGH